MLPSRYRGGVEKRRDPRNTAWLPSTSNHDYYFRPVQSEVESQKCYAICVFQLNTGD